MQSVADQVSIQVCTLQNDSENPGLSMMVGTHRVERMRRRHDPASIPSMDSARVVVECPIERRIPQSNRTLWHPLREV